MPGSVKMLGFSVYSSILVCFVITLTSVVGSEDVITVYLNKSLTPLNKELYADFIKVPNNSTVTVKLANVNINVSFIIFQAHSHIYNVTLYNNTLVRGSNVTGTNVGLYSSVKGTLDTFYILNANEIDLKLYISIHGYGPKDPIPGGCNMEFPVYISPFMGLRYNRDFIYVDAPMPLDYRDPNCLNVSVYIELVFYRLYLKERKFDEETYFEGIRNMLTLDKIKENGDEIPRGRTVTDARRMLSTYPGTGSVFVAVAYTKKPSIYSIYVPTHTYACSPLDSCEVLDDATSQFFCAALLFVGLFICYFGHRFFKTEMFLVGMFSGVILTYIVISLKTDLERPELLGVSVLSGVFFGAIWLLFWWFYGIPVLSVYLSTLYLGFLVSASFYYGVPGGQPILQEDGTFWTIFITLMFITSLALISTTFLSNILCCAVLGAYAAVFSIDHYVGSNLKYIMINTVRRAVVDNFGNAVLAPPFQWRDGLLTLIWVLLSSSGFLFQHYYSRGKAPFPPPPRGVRAAPEGPIYGAIVRQTRRGTVEPGMEPPLADEPVAYNYNERTPLLA